MKLRLILWSILVYAFACNEVNAWVGMAMPELKVEGRHLKDTHGNVVLLHGFAQTFSPWFNEQGSKWSNYDVNGCLSYNKGIIDKIMAAGWKVNFVRQHMDPYWSNTPGCSGRYEGEECFNESRFRKYLDEVFVPMAEYAVSKGLYVIMRPPGVFPENIEVGDVYNEYLINVWDIVSQHPKLKNHPNIMFELGNEPIRILGTDGTYGTSSQGHYDNLKRYFQSMVDVIRGNGARNILWIPGLGWQSKYKGYAVNPIEGENIGYAVHLYPGWFGSHDGGNTSTANGYDAFKAEWEAEIKPVSDFAPIVITEMDWADEKYNASWGKGHTGAAGGEGFGANFKKIMDETGNVSWLIFTDAHLLAQFKPTPPPQGVAYTFLTDPEACPWPAYHWYQEYALENYPRPDFVNRSHSDNGDGTYTNPVIHADFPDPDVIRVEDVYYMVSTTMHVFPGATLLKSYDLVNWEYCANPLEMIDPSDGYSLLNHENRYAQGQWASSLRYKNGKFYMLFNVNNLGGFLLTASNPEGPWDLKKLSRGYYDPGLLFDEDGKNYVVSGINSLKVIEINDDFEPVGNEHEVVLRDNSGLEGSHFYKIGDYYYIYATYGGWPASQTVFRSRNVFGPYEECEPMFLYRQDNIHQGALIETQTGEWWTMLFYDKGPYGRLPNLQPIKWVNDWPVIGINGNVVTTYQKPNVGKEHPVKVLPTNDNFRNYKLGMQWGWNHNPDNTKWSLFENPGHLRLKTASTTTDFLQARNTLTQRIFGYHSQTKDSYGTICMDVSGMKEGDMAGLAVIQDPYGYIAVTIEGGKKKLIWRKAEIEKAGTVPDLTTSKDISLNDKIYFRAVTNYGTGKCKFYYSIDNVNYTPFGSEYSMSYKLSVFMGIRFGIFNFATKNTGGYVDVDWFSTEESFDEAVFYDDSMVGYTENEITVDEIYTDKSQFEMMVGAVRSLDLKARFMDGHEENIASKCTYSVSDPEVLHVVNGQIVSKKKGECVITATYRDLLGNARSLEIVVSTTYFPFSAGEFNPNIFGTGSYDEKTRTLITSQYGFGGWKYDSGIDLSGYKELIVELQSAQSCGASFRIFDQNNYWVSPYMYNLANNTTRFSVDLTKLKTESGQAMDPSHIYIVGFWSYGGCPIRIKSMTLIEKAPNSIENLYDDSDAGKLVDVFMMNGIKIRTQVRAADAYRDLPNGIYIVGKKKVVIIK